MERSLLPPKAAGRLAQVAVELVHQLRDWVSHGHPADVMLSQYYRTHSELGARDRRFLSGAVFSFYRWWGWTRLSPDAPTEAALVGSCLLDADSVHPAVLLLAYKCGLAPESLRPAGAEPLEGKAAALARWLGIPQPPAIEHLVPDWVPASLFTPPDVPAQDHLLRCVRSFQRRPPTWLRAASGTEEALQQELMQAGLPVMLRIGTAIAVAGSSPLTALPDATRSVFEVQDLASQCVALACAPTPGQQWWDACAGAGGKALHLADLMQNKGCVVATDVRANALEELRRRAARSGATCLRTGRGAPDAAFDGVLVDAPCTNIGTWSRNPDARWRMRESDISEKAAVQADLLRRAADAVRCGGVLVYSVCTLTTAETVGVIQDFLGARQDFREDPPDGMTERRKTEGGKLWTWPWNGPCDGMFIARMKRAPSLRSSV